LKKNRFEECIKFILAWATNKSEAMNVVSNNPYIQWAESDPDTYLIGSRFPAERKGDMKTKLFVIPILVLAILTGIATPPVQAELLTLSIILAAAFSTAVVTTEVIKSETATESEIASKPSATESMHQARLDDSKIALVPQ
jgi:hypothetical protein